MTALRLTDVNEMVQRMFPGGGNECTGLGDGYALARRAVAATELRPGGFISGPTQFAIVDAAPWYLVFVTIGRVEPMADPRVSCAPSGHENLGCAETSDGVN